MTSEQHKRPYQTPEILEFGQMEDLTRGSGWGWADFWVFGISDPIGNCARNSCARS